MPAALRSAGTQTKAAQRLPGGCPASPPAAPGLAQRGMAAREPRLLARCWGAATRAWPGSHRPRALPTRPPAPTGAGARGARRGGASVMLAARPAANGRAGTTRAARGARVSRGTGCQSPASRSPRPAPARPRPAEGARVLSAARARRPSLRAGSAAALLLLCPRVRVRGSRRRSGTAPLRPQPRSFRRQRQARAARPPRDARGAGSAPGALPRWGERGGAGVAAARRLYLSRRRGGWHWGTPCCKIRAINTAPGMGARPRAAGNSFELRWVPSPRHGGQGPLEL